MPTTELRTPPVTFRRQAGGDAPISPTTEIRAGDRVVARATTQALPDAIGPALSVHIECASGHQPPWARRLLVHDVLARAERAEVERVLVIIPLGDSEVLDALRAHCHDVVTRSAGSTCIVEARLGVAVPAAPGGYGGR